MVEEFSDKPLCKEFRKEDIVSIEIGLDFGGNQSGHSFVARGYTDDYREVIAVKSKRIVQKDEEEEIDSNRLDGRSRTSVKRTTGVAWNINTPLWITSAITQRY